MCLKQQNKDTMRDEKGTPTLSYKEQFRVD